MKTCKKCGTTREDTKNKCLTCQRKYIQKHYQNNKEYYFIKAKKVKDKVREYLKQYKKDKKCIICGESHIATLDFHHRNRDNKYKEITALVNNASMKKLLIEIQKCDILCANCHRKLHYKEANECEG